MDRVRLVLTARARRTVLSNMNTDPVVHKYIDGRQVVVGDRVVGYLHGKPVSGIVSELVSVAPHAGKITIVPLQPTSVLVHSKQCQHVENFQKQTEPSKPTFPPNQLLSEGAIRMETKPTQ